MTSKCIMRLLNPRLFDLRGSVQWNGKEMLAVKLNELDGYRGKQISMIPQNPMTAFAPMLKLGKQMRKKSSTAIPMSCPAARCSV